MYVPGTPGNDPLNGTNFADTIEGFAGNDLLRGLGGDDTIYGGSGLDNIHGGNGNDLILGGDDDDILRGEAGNDRLEGGAGMDKLLGGAGNDTVFGGAGNDRLYGGVGADSFLYTNLTDSTHGSVDIIFDFEHGIDKIDLSALNYTGITSGVASADQLRITYSAASDRTYLRDDHSDFEIALKGDYRGVLTASDFKFATSHVNIGYFGGSIRHFGDPVIENLIHSLGYNATDLPTLKATDLQGLDAVFVLQQGIDGYSAKLLAAVPTLADYVYNGGVLIIGDSNVQGGEQLLPGLTGEHLIRNFAGGSQVDFVHDGGAIANGPGGILTDASFDGGAWSNDGYVLDSELNSSVVRVLTTNDPTHVVGFAYAYGAGAVYYSTLPQSEYLPLADRTSLVLAMESYAKNVISWAVDGHHDLLSL